MKPLLTILSSSLLLCSCADMYVTNSQVGGTGGPINAKDFGSGIHMTTCGVGAHDPTAIYIRLLHRQRVFHRRPNRVGG